MPGNRQYVSIPLVIAGAALLLGLTACGVNLGPSPDDHQPADNQAANDAGGSLVIDNQGIVSVCYVFVADANSGRWGHDRLGASHTVEHGSTFSIAGIPPGTYDIRANDCTNAVIDKITDVTLGDGIYTWTIDG